MRPMPTNRKKFGFSCVFLSKFMVLTWISSEKNLILHFYDFLDLKLQGCDTLIAHLPKSNQGESKGVFVNRLN